MLAPKPSENILSEANTSQTDDKVIRTVVFLLRPTVEQQQALAETTGLFTQAWQACVDVAWAMEKPTATELHKETYYPLKEQLGLKSQFLCSARNRALESVKSAKTRSRKNKKSQKPTSQKIPVRLDARTLSFDKAREIVSFTTQQGRLKFPLLWHKQALRYREWECQSGEFALNRKGRWVLRLHFEAYPTAARPTGRVVGVDRGIKRPLVSSDNRFLGQKSWKEKERRLLALRSRLQQKGTKSAQRKLKKLSGRLRRFKVDCDRVIAKQLLTPFQPGDRVVLEELTRIKERVGQKGQSRKKQRSHLGRWSYRRVASAIEYTAATRGILIAYVDPRYTSQTCSGCGMVKKSNRKNQSLYVCHPCDLQLNADLNAARNIRIVWLKANGFESGRPVNPPIVASVEAKAA